MIAARLRVRDVMQILKCGEVTARKYMRQMTHTENPLTVDENAVAAWLAGRTYGAAQTEFTIPKKKAPARTGARDKQH